MEEWKILENWEKYKKLSLQKQNVKKIQKMLRQANTLFENWYFLWKFEFRASIPRSTGTQKEKKKEQKKECWENQKKTWKQRVRRQHHPKRRRRGKQHNPRVSGSKQGAPKRRRRRRRREHHPRWENRTPKKEGTATRHPKQHRQNGERPTRITTPKRIYANHHFTLLQFIRIWLIWTWYNSVTQLHFLLRKIGSSIARRRRIAAPPKKVAGNAAPPTRKREKVGGTLQEEEERAAPPGRWRVQIAAPHQRRMGK